MIPVHYFYALTADFGEWVQVEGEKKPVWLVFLAGIVELLLRAGDQISKEVSSGS